MKIAIHEALLNAPTERERLQMAHELGADGVEYQAETLAERVEEIALAVGEGVARPSVVRLGLDLNLVSTDLAVRQAGLDRVRHAMTMAVDIGASGVVFAPHVGALALPNLMPWRAPNQLAAELLLSHLSWLPDLAYVFELQLYLLPLPQSFLANVVLGTEVLRKIKFDRHTKLATHLSDLATTPLDRLTDAHPHIQHLYVNGDRLPHALWDSFKEMNGWVTVALREGQPAFDLPSTLAQLRAHR